MDINKDDPSNWNEQGEAKGDLLEGLIFSFRGIIKLRINKFCENGLLKYLDKCEKPPERDVSESLNLENAVYEAQYARPELSEEELRSRPMFMAKLIKEEPHKSTIESIITGDQQIFNRLYEKEFPAVVRHIRDNSGTVEDAYDIFQDAIVLLIEISKRKIVAINESGIGNYLFEITRRLWFEQLRKKKLKKNLDYELLIIDGLEVEIDLFTEQDKFIDIRMEIEKLGDRCRELLFLFYYLNRDWKTITNELGYISESSARNQKYKCLEKIRKNLGKIN